MAKFSCMESNMSIEPLLHFNKITARQPMQKLVLGHSLGFKNSSYSALTKQRKNGGWIIRETYLRNDVSGRSIRGKIIDVMGPSGAGKSNGSLIFIRETFHEAYLASCCVISFLIAYLLFLAIQGLNFLGHFTGYAVVIITILTTAFLWKLLRIPKYSKWLLNIIKGRKCVKDKPEGIIKPNQTTSAAAEPEWMLTANVLLSAVSVYMFDSFIITCILLAYGALCGLLLLFIRRLYDKNVRK